MQARAHGTVAHLDIAGPDGPALSRFYAGLFGWAITPAGPGYARVATPDGSPDGGIAEAESPGLTIGIVVADLDTALRETVGLGGSVAMPATDNGWVRKAIVADPAGNRLTLIAADR